MHTFYFSSVVTRNSAAKSDSGKSVQVKNYRVGDSSSNIVKIDINTLGKKKKLLRKEKKKKKKKKTGKHLP